MQYMGSLFCLQLPTVDQFIPCLIELGPGAKTYEVNLSCAFRKLKVDPLDYQLLCLQWQNEYFIFARSCSAIFARSCSAIEQVRTGVIVSLIVFVSFI